ncbi:MAG: coproporphyrinogen dehydrogenase HemZ [Clostridia bacterium]|nr:coproporphyrinogen dehydrogenase HemZ [Clostridia bacterium]
MVLAVNVSEYSYELEKLTCSFFPEEHVDVLINGLKKDGSKPREDILSSSTAVSVNVSSDSTVVEYCQDGKTVLEMTETGTSELHAARLLYKVLSKVLDRELGWGILTGIRPSKLLIHLMEENGREEGTEAFKTQYLVSDKKTSLALSVADAEERIIKTSKPNSFSLYISIPFCPSRCSYCSFVSSAVNTETVRKEFEPYFENLLKEIEYTAETAKSCGLELLSVYVGGGTPSTLSAEQIRRLLKTVNHGFDMSACTEFTFEAGRPDTITTDKLAACLEGGVDRISINPQTMSDDVLAAVGRAHTASDVIKVFDDARRLGFKNINMDLIAGLPTDTFEGFKHSLSELIKLSPESITVHTLAYKRSSDLDYRDGLFSATRNVSLMVDFANDTLYANGYIPYYMYRQAKSVGNLENVGWCKPGFESRYNIFMMEECHTILACGAGAVTKLKEPGGMQISRIFNFKYPFEYNSNFAEQINRKKAISEFYGHTGISENC